jgi:DNA transformation protein and related proteins
MATTESYLQFVKDQLAGFGEFQAKKMFGGVGFFKDDVMFGVIKNDVFMLRTDPENLGEYAGQAQFTVDMKGKDMTMPYHVVPTAVLEDRERLAGWAREAFERTLVAKAGKKKTATKKK